MYTTLIQASELASHLNDSNWVILDCRHDLLNPTAGSDAFAASLTDTTSGRVTCRKTGTIVKPVVSG